ncbi:MAG: MerR family transcriptional regulator [Silicimonas sp.]|nr:MerR family transcriptional regulator [Silicimonas sp.]
MEKSRDAFRTISEVAEWLDVPTHVLRFWESRFSQIKPVKRAGGRRYYRPSDMRVIGGVKTLLHDQGMTIRGVQKLFREQGIKHISSHAPELYGDDEVAETPDSSVIEHTELAPAAPAPAARSTRDAEPDPIIDDVEEVAEVDEEPMLQFTHNDGKDKAPAPPRIEVPSDVPQSDPDDDDANFATGPGVAARLRSIPRDKLVARSDLLAAAVEKLRALQERVR